MLKFHAYSFPVGYILAMAVNYAQGMNRDGSPFDLSSATC